MLFYAILLTPLCLFCRSQLELINGFAIYGINGTWSAYAPIYLVRTDTNGSTICLRTSGILPDSSFTLTPTDTTGTSGVVHGDSVFSLIENADSLTESDNCIVTSVKNIPNHEEDIILFPNPNTGKFTITLNISESNPVFEIYNIFGDRVYTSALNPPAGGQGDNLINISQPSGVYLYRILSENRELIGEGKFVIQK